MAAPLESASVQSATQRPTRVRFAVVTMAILLGMIIYLDRACMGTLKTPIERDLNLSAGLWGFTYDAGPRIGADRRGVLLVLLRVRHRQRPLGGPGSAPASCSPRSSLPGRQCTFASGLAQGLVSMVVIRFLFGMGEAGAWPAITRTLSRWIPYCERGTAQGIVWTGAHITAGVTPMIITQLMLGASWHGLFFRPLTWREVFALISVPGLIWAAVWYFWFRDEPEQHGRVNAAELGYIAAGRTSAARDDGPHGWAFWRRLLTHPQHDCTLRDVPAQCFIFYFNITWFHRYLEQGRGLQGWTLAFFAGLPLLLSVIADVARRNDDGLGGPPLRSPLGPCGRGLRLLRGRGNPRFDGGPGRQPRFPPHGSFRWAMRPTC